MNSKTLQLKKTIRFRRWSRAGYAIFCSLACSVTIGQVVGSISDKSLQKVTGTSYIDCGIHRDADSEDHEVTEPVTTLQQVQETTFIQTSTFDCAACSQQTTYIFIHHGG